VKRKARERTPSTPGAAGTPDAPSTPRPAPAVDRLKLLGTITRAISAAGQHAPSPFWQATFDRFYAPDAPAVRSLVARVGRGGAKSYSSCIFAVNEVLFGDWRVPPNERHYFAFVSARKVEVSERRSIIEGMLRALEVPFETAGDLIRLLDRPLGFRFYACDVNAVSGFRCIGYVADELAKWAWELDAADPAKEVLASLDAMCVTHAAARSWLISSPWSIDDEHAQRFDAGDTEAQIVAYAPSWEANPGIDRETCLAKSKGNMRLFRREYEAIPATTESNALDLEDIEAAIARHESDEPVPGVAYCAIDSSSGKQDTFAWAIFAPTLSGGITMLTVKGVQAHERLTRDAVIRRIGADCRAYGVTLVFGDNYGKGFIEDYFARERLGFEILDWTLQSKRDAMNVLRALLRDGVLSIPADARLKSELANLQSRLSPYGTSEESFATRGRDYLSTLVTMCMAVAKQRVSLRNPMGAGMPDLGDEDARAILWAATVGLGGEQGEGIAPVNGVSLGGARFDPRTADHSQANASLLQQLIRAFG